jgi:asparagine synthase (glutamine-hydrolysing)
MAIMCGISGLVNIGNEKMLSAMSKAIAHRGPDDSGQIWFSEKRTGLAHRRLAIIDLSPAGHQPMSIGRQKHWITFNGEIYNYKEIRDELAKLGSAFTTQTDTEVLLQAFIHWGADCLARLNGIFAFAIYDREHHSLFVARDRLGVKPVYYVCKDSGFAFASEIKSFLQANVIQAEPDWHALFNPTRYQISPSTGFKNIYSLPAAHFLTFTNGRCEIGPYWKINPCETLSLEAEALENAEALLLAAIKRQSIADVEVGAMLSGGLDSSLISVLMQKLQNKRLRTFTTSVRTIDQKFERMPDDSDYAKKLAQAQGFIHEELVLRPDIVSLLPKMIWHVEEPLADAATINTFLISHSARKNGIVVLLNGMGADEIWGGYRKHLACLRAEVYQKTIPSALRRCLEQAAKLLPVASRYSGIRSFRWLKRFFSFSSLPPLERYLASDLSFSKMEYEQIFAKPMPYEETNYYVAQKKAFMANDTSYLTKMCLLDTSFFLPQHNLLYSDKAAMAAGVESRPPFTDHVLTEFAFTLSPELRIKGSTQKYLIRKIAAQYLPQTIVKRGKASFGTPLRAWLRGPLKDMIDETLSYQKVKQRGLFNPTVVQEKIMADRAGRADHAYLIWQLLTMEIWFRIFMDCEKS